MAVSLSSSALIGCHLLGCPHPQMLPSHQQLPFLSAATCLISSCLLHSCLLSSCLLSCLFSCSSSGADSSVGTQVLRLSQNEIRGLCSAYYHTASLSHCLALTLPHSHCLLSHCLAHTASLTLLAFTLLTIIRLAITLRHAHTQDQDQRCVSLKQCAHTVTGCSGGQFAA